MLLGDFNAPPTALSTQVMCCSSSTAYGTSTPQSSSPRTCPRRTSTTPGPEASARLDYVFAAEEQRTWTRVDSWISFAHPQEISDHVGVGAELGRRAQDEDHPVLELVPDVVCPFFFCSAFY